MKTIVALGVAVMLLGCAHERNRNQGAAPSNAFESGPRVDPELPYRQGPGLPSNERDYPRPAREGTK
jgi:hypothetical protein